ncbi:MAG: deoxyribose-phosphate aldolase, partial [Psychroserpens sp.]|nr:deoxyribose-phosphate aldolase [Psychroserpens sp.]
MRYIVLIIISLLVVNCNTTQSEDLSAQAIIDTSIEAVGGTKIESSIISFKFRNLEYAAKRSKGIFAFSRQKIDSSSGTVQLIKDVLSNSGFERFLNDSIVEVPDTM